MPGPDWTLEEATDTEGKALLGFCRQLAAGDSVRVEIHDAPVAGLAAARSDHAPSLSLARLTLGRPAVPDRPMRSGCDGWRESMTSGSSN